MAQAGSIKNGVVIGTSNMTQLTVGFQLGAEAFSQIIFFENEAALNNFTAGNFEFSADASAVAITAGASATANTGGGTSTGLSGWQERCDHEFAGLSQGHGYLYRRQGWPDVSGNAGRTEIQLQAAVVAVKNTSSHIQKAATVKVAAFFVSAITALQGATSFPYRDE